MMGYAKLPYNTRRVLKQAHTLRKAANRAERGMWREDRLTREQEQVVFHAVRLLRDEAEKAERQALCQ